MILFQLLAESERGRSFRCSCCSIAEVAIILSAFHKAIMQSASFEGKMSRDKRFINTLLFTGSF